VTLTNLAIALGFFAAFMTGMWWSAKDRLDDVQRDVNFWKKRYQENEKYIEELRKRA
jgi:hypothetical protein